MDNETTDISDIPVEKSLRSDIGHAVAVKVAASRRRCRRRARLRLGCQEVQGLQSQQKSAQEVDLTEESP
jgi:hypothetical protein